MLITPAPPRSMALVVAIAALVVGLALIWLAMAPVASDDNAVLRATANITYFAQRWS